MNVWIIVAAVLAVGCAGLAIDGLRLRKRLRRQNAQAEDAEALRREIRIVRGEDVRRRREIASLHRALEDEQAHCDELLRELDLADEELRQAQQRADQADARRIQTEKDVYAGRMRAGLLEQQLKEAQEGQLAQERLYQDIIREREEALARLQDQQPRRKPRRRSDALEQQVTINDLLKGA